MEHKIRTQATTRYSKGDDWQERFERDTALTNRIKAGYTPAEPTPDRPKPKITDGALNKDGQNALNELHTAYEKLCAWQAKKVAVKYRNNPCVTLEDLKQETIFALYHSALKWDPNIGASFTGHAIVNIRNYLYRYSYAQETTIKLPDGVRNAVRRYNGLSAYTSNREKIAKYLGTTLAKTDEIATWAAETTQMGSIDRGYFVDDREKQSILSAGNKTTRSAVAGVNMPESVEDAVVKNEDISAIRESIDIDSDILSSEEVTLLKRIDLADNPSTLTEVAKELGISIQNASKLRKMALSKLRHPSSTLSSLINDSVTSPENRVL